MGPQASSYLPCRAPEHSLLGACLPVHAPCFSRIPSPRARAAVFVVNGFPTYTTPRSKAYSKKAFMPTLATFAAIPTITWGIMMP